MQSEKRPRRGGNDQPATGDDQETGSLHRLPRLTGSLSLKGWDGNLGTPSPRAAAGKILTHLPRHVTLLSWAAQHGKGKRAGLPWGTGKCGYRPHWHEGKGNEKIVIVPKFPPKFQRLMFDVNDV